MSDNDPEMDTLWVFPPGSDLSIFDDVEAFTDRAQRSFAQAAQAAVAENDRLGIPSWSRDGDDLVARLNGKVVERRPWNNRPEPT